MSAYIINGKEISEMVIEEAKKETEELCGKGIMPCLSVIIVGDDPASKVYVRNKKRMCEKVGIKSASYELPEATSEKELLGLIDELNKSEQVNGILVQLPLPKHINERKVIMAISPEKDVDCFHPQNVGALCIGEPTFLPCTPAGVIELLKRSNIEISGKNAVVIGRSNIVGKPVSMLLTKENATVTVCHTKTKDMKSICKNADIIVVSAGREKTLTADMVKEGAVIIDVGINRNADGKLTGDVDFEECAKKASAITPVPGGVGPMTIAMLMKNCVYAAKMQKGI